MIGAMASAARKVGQSTIESASAGVRGLGSRMNPFKAEGSRVTGHSGDENGSIHVMASDERPPSGSEERTNNEYAHLASGVGWVGTILPFPTPPW